MKKFLTVLLVGCIAMSMTACGEKKTDDTAKAETTIETTAAESTAAETTAEETTATATDVTTAETTDASDASEVELNAGQSIAGEPEINAVLVPEEATILTYADGLFVLASTDSFEDLTTFYKEAIETLEAVGEELDLAAAQELLGDSAVVLDGMDVWAWEGTYEDGKPLAIAISSITGTSSITIQY